MNEPHMTVYQYGLDTWQLVLIVLLAVAGYDLVMAGWVRAVDAYTRWRETRYADAVDDAADLDGDHSDEYPTDGAGWMPPLRWAANGRKIHLADCQHAAVSDPIRVWTVQAAASWAMAEGLHPCQVCRPFRPANTATEVRS